MLPYGLMNRIDWRNQVTLMFQVDSYRLNVARDQMPAIPATAQPHAGQRPGAARRSPSRRSPKGVWDVRVGNNNGGPAIEFADHLVLFEANGSAAATLARIDAANRLVPGKQVTRLIVTHHHFDHTAGLRAAVSRGLAVISHRGNEAIFREMIARPAVVFPDELAKKPASAGVHSGRREAGARGQDPAPRDLPRARPFAHGERRVRLPAGGADHDGG